MVGFYYWRGRPLPLSLRGGQYYVSLKSLPAWLRAVWRDDVKAGRVKLENP